MSHSFSSALPETSQPTPPGAIEPQPDPGSSQGGRPPSPGSSRGGPGGRPPRNTGLPPFIERVAGWSARHYKTAIAGWLVLVAAAFIVGQLLPAKNLPQYDAGQSGRAEHALQRLGFTVAPAESVLIQRRGSGAPGTFGTDPA